MQPRQKLFIILLWNQKLKQLDFIFFRYTFEDWKLQGINLCDIIKQKELCVIGEMLRHSLIKTTEKFYTHYNINSIIRGFIKPNKYNEDVED